MDSGGILAAYGKQSETIATLLEHVARLPPIVKTHCDRTRPSSGRLQPDRWNGGFPENHGGKVPPIKKTAVISRGFFKRCCLGYSGRI